MEVFKTKESMRLLHGYDRYELLSNQLVKTNDQKLIAYFRSNSNFEPVVDDVLVKLAPDIRQVIKLEDPIRMRKEDIINELRRYKISVDIYAFSNELSNQLIMARKLLKRNFVTVLDRIGRPVFIDDVDLPVPASQIDDITLSEPDEPEIEKFVKPKKLNDKEEFDIKKSTVMSVVESKDEIEEINEGDSYSEFVQNIIEGKNPIIDEKNKKIEEFMAKQEEENRLKQEMLTRDKKVDNETIVPENYAYLIDYPIFSRRQKFTEQEKESFKTFDWKTINVDVLEIFIRYYDIKVNYEEDMMKNRWLCVDAVRTFIDNTKTEKEKHYVELSVLQYRHNEFVKNELDYKKATVKALKTKLTSLKVYGAEAWYPNHYMHISHMRNFTVKVYTLVKLGLAIPKTEEGIDELLIKNRKTNMVKSINTNSTSYETVEE